MSSDNTNWGPSGKVVFDRTYSRAKPNGERETWTETVARVAEGNLALVHGPAEDGWTPTVWREYNELVEHIEDFRLLPAGRHLNASGVKGRQFLMNCFAAGTMVHTDQGVHPIEKLTGSTVNVLSEGGVYREAKFDSYGEQAIYKVTLARGEEFYATADHQWVTLNSDGTHRTLTKNLAGKRVPYNPAPRPQENESYLAGVAHGIVYGDGQYSGPRATAVNLFGAKRSLVEFVEPYSRRGSIEHDDRTYVGTLPGQWKQLPVSDCSQSYWRGFINGLIATDGNVRSGSVRIHQSDAEALAEIRQGAMWAGYVPTGIKMERERSPFTGEYAPSHCLTLRGWSLTSHDLIRDDQRAVFNPRKADTRTARVKSVEPTGRVEEVYCAVEPETHTITVGSGILTGQCWTSGWTEKLSDHYEFAFLRLMEGGGVGANYSTHHIEKYGVPRRPLDVHVVCDPDHPDYQDMLDAGVLSTEYDSDWTGGTQVEDSREGWAAGLVELIDTFMDDGRVSHRNRVFDVSRVRQRGARLKTFGGTASGPEPFARMLHKVAATLNEARTNPAYDYDEMEGRHLYRLTPLQVMEIDHYIAECVVSGGTRRSARMAMVRWDDPFINEFLTRKADTGEHWTTNISVEVDSDFTEALSSEEPDPYLYAGRVQRHRLAREVHEAVVTGMLTSGEPGYWNSTLSNHGEVEEVYCTNPCGEITLQMWEACCLGHVNLDAFAPSNTAGMWNEGGLVRAHQLMARFLIRATSADINDEKSLEVEQKNRRIGVGHLGVQGFIVKNGWRYSDVAVRQFSPGYETFRNLLDRMYRVVRGEARDYAFELRIPEPIKVTTVAPTGSVAKLPGVTEGIHTIMYRWFIRRIRFATTDKHQVGLVQEAIDNGMETEWDKQASNTMIVQYPTKDPLVAQVEAMGMPADMVETAEDLGVDTMLAFQAMYQRHYADNAVSFTVNVPAEPHQNEYMLAPPDSDPFGMSPPKPTPERVEEVSRIITKYLPVLKGTTIMLDGSRQQAPYEKITEEQYEAATFKVVEDSVELDCKSGACPI